MNNPISPSDTIINILQKAVRLPEEAFIHELFRQILHREPQHKELNYYRKKLTHTQRIEIIKEIMLTKEAFNLYTQPTQSEKIETMKLGLISDLIYRFYNLDDTGFIYSLYQQFLNRSPDLKEIQIHLNNLVSGFQRKNLMVNFLLSKECRLLLESDIVSSNTLIYSNTSHPSPIPSVTIGFFLGYSVKVGKHFDGEGIGRFIIRLIEGLLCHDKNVTITVVTTTENYEDINNGFKKTLLSFPNRLSVLKFETVEWVNENTDVDIWIVPYIGMDLALKLKKPFIVCLHDLVYMHFKDIYIRLPDFYDGFTSIVKQVAKKAKKVIFNSIFTRNHEGLKFLKLSKDKTHVIRLAPPVEEYNVIDSYNEVLFRDKYKLYNNYIVYPSVIRLHKNHDRLIEAFLKFRQTPEGFSSNLSLVLTDHFRYGPKEKEIIALLNDCNNVNIRDSVIFLGRIAPNDIPLLYKYAMGTIVPTLFEGSCPFQLLESLIMDTPVAVSKIEVVKEVITDIEKFITFNPYSTDEITLAIHQLWQHNDNLLEQQKNAIQHILKRNWTDIAQEYYTLVTKLVINWKQK
ncbi:DUF4214 domain-containing protein [Bacillus cereus]|uniref:DUF4214 domain-containing protein n=1 Tax=Bacillus cereus TaxID=1396 RepID=UPI0018F30A24|nr:DUF4214 domain-containing protein [Bacillus cereus]MBJ8055332.1 DUF4214 domain-containing protein [Bacillus cereus]